MSRSKSRHSARHAARLDRAVRRRRFAAFVTCGTVGAWMAASGGFGLLGAPAAHAAVYAGTGSVIVATGDCTLSDAITAANTDTATGGCAAGDSDATDTVALSADVTLTSTLKVTSAITLRGNGHIIDGGGHRIFEVSSAAGNLTIGNAALQHGAVTGANGSGTGSDGANARGGAVLADTGATLRLDHVVVRDNKTTAGDATAPNAFNGTCIPHYPGQGCAGVDGADGYTGGSGYGGAIAGTDATITVTQSKFVGNTVTGGNGSNGGNGATGDAGSSANCSGGNGSVLAGGIFVVDDSKESSERYYGGNGGDGGDAGRGGDALGAAVYANGGTLTISQTTIVDNTAQSGSAGMYGGAGRAGATGGPGNCPVHDPLGTQPVDGVGGRMANAGHSASAIATTAQTTTTISATSIVDNTAKSGTDYLAGTTTTTVWLNGTSSVDASTIAGNKVFMSSDIDWYGEDTHHPAPVLRSDSSVSLQSDIIGLNTVRTAGSITPVVRCDNPTSIDDKGGNALGTWVRKCLHGVSGTGDTVLIGPLSGLLELSSTYTLPGGEKPEGLTPEPAGHIIGTGTLCSAPDVRGSARPASGCDPGAVEYVTSLQYAAPTTRPVPQITCSPGAERDVYLPSYAADRDGDPTYTLIGDPTSDAMVLSAATIHDSTLELTCTDADHGHGAQDVAVRVTGPGGSTARLTVTVVFPTNSPSVTESDSYFVRPDTTLTVDVGNGVLANDWYPAGATVTTVTKPANGTLTLNKDGSFSYTPTADYSGDDGFTYQMNTATTTVQGSVTLHVQEKILIPVQGSMTYGELSTIKIDPTTTNLPRGVSASGTVTCTRLDDGSAITTSSQAGSYELDGSSCTGLTLSGTDATQYYPVYMGVAGGFQVYRAKITITVNATAEFGSTTATYSYDYTHAPGITVSGTPECDWDAIAVGTHALKNCSGLDLSGANKDDYRATYASGTLTITPYVIDVTVHGRLDFAVSDNPSWQYTLPGTLSVLGRHAQINGNSVTCDRTTAGALPAAAVDGTNTIDGTSCQGLSLTGDSADDFTLAYHGTLDVTTVPIRVTVSDTATFDSPGTLKMTHAVAGALPDGISVTGTLLCRDAANIGSGESATLPGTYDLDTSLCKGLSVEGTHSYRYTLDYSGTLTITPKKLAFDVVAWAVWQSSGHDWVISYKTAPDWPASGISGKPHCVTLADGSPVTDQLELGDYDLDPASCSGITLSGTAADKSPAAGYTVDYTGSQLHVLKRAAALHLSGWMYYGDSYRSHFSYPARDFPDSIKHTGSHVSCFKVKDASGNTYTLTDDLDDTTPVGTYTIVGDCYTDIELVDPAHNVVEIAVGGTFTVKPAPDTVGVSAVMTYGDSDVPTFRYTLPTRGAAVTGTSVTCSSVMVGDTSTAIGPTLPAGTYPVDPSSCSGMRLSDPTDATNYTVTYAGNVVVNRADLYTEPRTDKITYGTDTASVTLTPTYELLNGDTVDVDTGSTCTIRDADGHAVSGVLPVGDYAIVCTAGSADNYIIHTSTDGMLIVTQATPTATLSANPNPVVTGDVSVLTLYVSPPDGGTATFSDSGKTIVGCGKVTVDGTTGTATCRVRYPNPGARHISATFNGSHNLSAATAKTITLTVREPDSPPGTRSDSYSATEDTQRDVDETHGVLANDTDPDGDTLTVALIQAAAHGTVKLQADGAFVYTPDPNFNGTDHFSYQASDGTLLSAVTTVSVTVAAVNDPPVARPDTYAVAPGDELNIDTAHGVLANDTDVDGDTLTAALKSGPARGVLTLNKNGSFDYTAPTTSSDPVTFSYTADDGHGGSATATVTITVSSAAGTPPDANPDAYHTDENSPLRIGEARGVLNNDNPPDEAGLQAVLVRDPAHGTVSLERDGSFNYTPATDYAGPDTFTYQAHDADGESAPATVTITVRPVDQAPTAHPDRYITPESLPLTVVTRAGLLVNDSDVDSPHDTLRATVAEQPAHGTVRIAADGGFDYQPDPGYVGSDSFTYRAGDGTKQSAPATATITVVAQSAPAAAASHTYHTAEDMALTVPTASGLLSGQHPFAAAASPAAAVRTLAVHTLAPAATGQTVLLATSPRHGTLTLHADGSFRYQPDPNFSGTDSFAYRITDGTTTSAPGTVTVKIAATDDAPTVTPASSRVNAVAGSPLSPVTLSAHDVDDAPTTLRLSASGLPTGLTFSARTDGTPVISGVPARAGTVQVTVTATDPHGKRGSATIRFVIAAGSGSGTPTAAKGTTHAGTGPVDTLGHNGTGSDSSTANVSESGETSASTRASGASRALAKTGVPIQVYGIVVLVLLGTGLVLVRCGRERE